MPQTTNPTPQESQKPADPTPTPRDIQRAALRDLVSLATESAATEADVERRYKAGQEEARARFESNRFAIDERYKKLTEEVQQKYAERVAQARAAHAQATAGATAADKAARQRAAADFAKVDQDVRKKFEQEKWLADGVLEVAQNTVKADAKKAREDFAGQLASLDAMESRARDLMKSAGAKGALGGEAPPAPAVGAEEADATYHTAQQQAEASLDRLSRLTLPRLMSGAVPWILLVLLCVGAAIAVQVHFNTMTPVVQPLAIVVGATAVAAVLLGVLLKMAGRKQVVAAYAPFKTAVATARAATAKQTENAAQQQEQASAAAVAQHKRDVGATRAKYAPVLEKAKQKRDAALAAQKQAYGQSTATADATLADALGDASQKRDRALAELRQRQQQEQAQAKKRFEQEAADVQRQYDEARGGLEHRLRDGLEHIQAPMGRGAAALDANGDGGHAGANGNGNGNGSTPVKVGGNLVHDWSEAAWKGWKPPRQFASQVRFGALEVDLPKIADEVPRKKEAKGKDGREPAATAEAKRPLNLKLPERFAVPTTLDFPNQASMLIECDRTLRDEGLRILQMTMTRLLTGLPAGRVRFTIIDPVGFGQNFAGFMHLADHDEALVGTRIWTESEQIEQRLADLTEHMETVIQKYLRNEYETIDEYNAQAGELAEPYRFLVISDFPVGFGAGEGFRRLSSIASSGARCGIYTLILRDTRLDAPNDTVLEDLRHHSVNLVQEKQERLDEDGRPTGEVLVNRFVWDDETFRKFPLRLDPPPSEERLTQILDAVGKGAKEAKRVEVNFDTIAPKEDEFFTLDSGKEMAVPVGRMGATRLQYLRLGRGVAQHVLIAGKTGSGKSTLLHAMITNLAMWYSPEQVEFYLIDFKKGVEFKTYADNMLPHARAIAVESDREFGLSVLLRLDAELTRRGDLFRKAGTQDLAGYRGTPGAQIMPRSLLMIDEFQEFFTEDDKLSQEASLLLDRLVRQGRAFGMHVLLGSQTIGGSSGLPRSTLGQMAVRIALQTSEADSHMILGDGNSAARLLTRPGEAIYNDQGGLVEANSPFQVAWLTDARRDEFLARVNKLEHHREAFEHRPIPAPPVIFEGNAPADLALNKQLAALLDAPPPATPPSAPVAWLGDPVAIKDPQAIAMRRQSGVNVMIIGQQDEQAMGMLVASVLSLSAQHTATSAQFYLFDGSAPDSQQFGILPGLKDVVPQETKVVDYRLVNEAVNELAQELEKRRAGGDDASDATSAPAIYVVLYGLQRYRMLRKTEDDFSFSLSSSSDEAKAPNTGKQFADLMREGPQNGIHVLAWTDTPSSVERTLDRNGLREFDNRILFQMSATDSSNLIDSPLANKLGYNRALVYSEEQGLLEKFRPYAVPSKEWMGKAREKLAGRKATAAT